jgi:hypothetical protein
VIIVGIDDTDIKGSPGTNQLARLIVLRLGAVARGAIICRHQLFFDPRVPYTSGNGSASIQLPAGDDIARDELIDRIRHVMQSWYIEGSDPGLAVSDHASAEMKAFAARAQTDVVTQDDARTVAGRAGCYLEGLGGTNQGIIGALSAIALAAGGQDGRVVHMDGWPWPDPLTGVQPAATIRQRGVAEIRTTTNQPFVGDTVDLGNRLRPNWRDGRVVLFVEPPADPHAVPLAVKFL